VWTASNGTPTGTISCTDVTASGAGQFAHSISLICVTKTSQLMLYGEIIAVCSEIHTKHINTLCGQNVEQ